MVTPLAGVWIEIRKTDLRASAPRVTPLAGVWIEIRSRKSRRRSTSSSLPSRECGLKFALCPACYSLRWSLPSRECGLKWDFRMIDEVIVAVTPLAGVWIEIPRL